MWTFCGLVWTWIPVKKKKKKAKGKKKVHTAGGGHERADGPCGSVVMGACGWVCRRVGTWMRMAVNKKEKRRKQTWRVKCVDGSVGVWACGWACSHVDMRMRMAVNKKEKRKKHLLIGSERADGRADVWACGRADGRAEADDCKERKKERKGKKKERLTGFQSGQMGVWTCCGWACVNALAGGGEWL